VTPASCGAIEAARGRSIWRSSLVSLDRVRQIIDQAKRPDIQRAELENKYGTDPQIIALPDETSIEVLCLCDDIRGWTARVWKLEWTVNIEPIRHTRRLAQDNRRTASEGAKRWQEDAS
jgi:hypothetical protein